MSWYWFALVMALTVVVPVATGLIVYKDMDKAGRYFFFLLVAILLTEIAGHFYAKWYGNNLTVLNGYTFVSAILIGQYIYSLNKMKSMLYVFYAVSFFSVVESIVRGPGVLNNYSLTTLSIVTLVGLLFVFYEMAKAEIDTRHLLITAAVFFYFLSNFTYFLTASHLQETEQFNYLLGVGVTKGITNMICYGWYAIGIWKAFI